MKRKKCSKNAKIVKMGGLGGFKGLICLTSHNQLVNIHHFFPLTLYKFEKLSAFNKLMETASQTPQTPLFGAFSAC